MKCWPFVLLLLTFAGCASDAEVGAYDGPNYYDGGAYYDDPRVYDYDRRYLYGRTYYYPAPYYYGGGYYRSRHDRPDHDDHDTGPGRDRERGDRPSAVPPSPGPDVDSNRLRERTAPSRADKPVARPGGNRYGGGGRGGKR